MSNFKNFIQWNNDTDVYKVEDALLKEDKTAYRIFKFLIHNMDQTNKVVVSQKVMGKFLGVSRQTISKSVKYLKEKQLINVYKTGISNVYVVNHNIVRKY